MPGTILNVVVYGWFGATAALAQLPPEVMVDRHLLHAERLMAQGDPVRALEAMDKVLALQQEHDFALPEDFDFKYADVAFSAGSLQTAMDSVNRYLRMAAREDRFYREALELSLDIEASLPAQNSCSDQPKGAECWMELSGQPGCSVWISDLQPDENVTWSAICAGSMAQGTGTIKRVWNNGKSTVEGTGRLQYGKPQGDWIVREANGDVSEGPYVAGLKHGLWVERRADSAVWKGAYVAGMRQGRWVVRDAYRSVWEGPYVDGMRNGDWVVRHADGAVWEGPYFDDKMHGDWVWRLADGGVWKGQYVYGEMDGDWLIRNKNGSTSNVYYRNGVAYYE